MSSREVVVLGTASQVPTRERNHVATLVRLGDISVLVDCGEGTQRQMLHAGVRSSQLTALCVTHEHGDHCFGVPGVLQRRRLDGARGVQTAPLLHRVPTVGYRFVEDNGRRLVPDLLAAAGIAGPEISRQRGQPVRGVSLDDVSVARPEQRVAIVMDTALCDGAFALAQDCDLLVCEATFLDAEAELAREHRHLTAGQAAEIAVQSGVRRLVLTHFSSRYDDLEGHIQEAGAVHSDVTVARDLDVVAVPARQASDRT